MVQADCRGSNMGLLKEGMFWHVAGETKSQSWNKIIINELKNLYLSVPSCHSLEMVCQNEGGESIRHNSKH